MSASRTRIQIDRSEMLERARRHGYLFGKSLRQGQGTHHAAWRDYCRAHRIPFIALSLGRHHAHLTFDLRTIDPGLTFSGRGEALSDDIASVVLAAERIDLDRVEASIGPTWIAVRGLTYAEGFALADGLARVAGRHHRELTQLPSNVVSLQEYRRMRATVRGRFAG